MKGFLAAVLLGLSVWFPAKAQTTLTGVNEIGGTPLNDAIAGDFNGDGLTDFVFVANSQNGQLQLTTYLGRGDGFPAGIKNSFFSIGPSWSLYQLSPRAGGAADFNGDGKQDIVFIAEQTATHSPILLIADGNGDGTFGMPQQVNISEQPVAPLYVLDLNNDHKPDLLFIGGNNNIVVLPGNGDGTFRPQVVTSSSSLPSSNIVGVNDLNGDGFPDLLLVGTNSSYYTALGNGQGSFTSTGNAINLGVSPQSTTTETLFINFVGMQDFTNNNKVDLLFELNDYSNETFTASNSLLFLPGNGDGTFGTGQVQDVGLTGIDRTSGEVVSYSGITGDFLQDGSYEALLVGSTYVCCEIDLISFNTDGTATNQSLSSYSGLSSLDNGQSNPQQFSSYLPLTFGPHQTGFVDGTGMLFTFVPNSQAALVYLPTYFLSFETSPSLPVSTSLQFFGTSALVASSVTAQPPLSVSNQQITSGNPAGCCSASVTFTPTQPGAFSGVVSIHSNDVVNPLNVPVFAYTGSSAFTVSPASLNFGYVKTGATGSQQITVTNTSGSAAYVTQIAVSGNTPFTQMNNCIGAIASSCSITVTYAPTAVASSAGTLTITDENGLATSVSLAGNGYSTGPVLTFGTSSVNFPEQLVGAKATQSLQVSDTGDAPLVIQSMTAAAPFSVTTPCTTIQPGGSCEAVLSFQPTTAGAQSQTLTVVSNAVNSPQTLPLTGTGVMVNFSPTPASLNFGYQKVGTTSAAQQITLKNVSSQAVSIASIGVGAPFTQTNHCTGAIASGATCTLSVTVTPTTSGVQNQNLVVTDQYGALTSVNIPLSVTGYSSGPIATLPAAISFSNQPVATASTAQSITLSNTGDAPLQVQAVAASGAFQESTTCGGSTLAPGANCTIRVTFTPASIGQQTGTLTVTDNAANSPQQIPLSGLGTGVQLQIAPASLDLGNEFVGVTGLPQTVTLSNTGNLPVTVQSVSTSSSFGSLNACGNTIAPGDSCAIGVFFQPAALGAQTGTLTITDDAPGSPQTIALSGTGSSITVAASSGSSTSATIQQGGTATYNLTVKAEDGFTGNLAVSCDGAPSGLQCTANPASLAFTAGTASTSVVFTVGPAAQSARIPSTMLERLASLALLCGAFSAGFRRRGQQLGRSLALVLACVLLCTMAACGGGGSNMSTPPGGGSGNPAPTQTQYVLQATFAAAGGENVQTPLNLTVVSQ